MTLLSMFLLFVSVSTTLASFSADIEISLYEYEDDCSKESGLGAADIEIIRKNHAVPDNEIASQWAKCMMQKHNVIKSDGTFNMDVKTIAIPADTDTVIRAFPICKNQIGKDMAGTARLMMNCYLSNSDGLVMGIRSRMHS